MSKSNTRVFDNLPFYTGDAKAIKRLNQRRRSIIEPFVEQINEATILDLGCHDGRWSYAMAAAGARSVVGIEGRQELIDRFSMFPDGDAKSKVSLVCGDVFDELDVMVSRGQTFDVVAILGVFYHVMDHFRLLQLVRQLEPKLVIIDSEFIEADNAMIQLVKESTDNVLNSIPQIEGQGKAIIGIPSKRALESMSEALAYELNWIDKRIVFGDDREGLHDYFRNHRKVRSTCYLTPISYLH